MAINSIEIAIDCEDPMTDGVNVLRIIIEAIGVDPEKDVNVVAAPAEDGRPILFAVIASGAAETGSEDDE